MLKDYLSAHMAATVVESERGREGEALFNYTFCALQIFVPHFFVELVFSLVSFAFLRLWLSANKHIHTKAHTHTHTDAAWNCYVKLSKMAI